MMLLSAPPRRQLSCRHLPGNEPGPPLRGSKNERTCDRAEASKPARFSWIRCAIACTALFSLSLSAHASLGGTFNSVESDRVHMNASARVTQHDNYEVHELEASGGTVVDEYVSSEGKVFAVTWHGQFPPPMQQILGTYFQQYSAALQARRKMYGHRPVNIQQQGLVVQTGGHMRAHSGRAYLPDQVPQGMTVSQIQ